MERWHKSLATDGHAHGRTRAREEPMRAALHLAADVERSQLAHDPPVTVDGVAAFAERLRANVRAVVHLAPTVLDVLLAPLVAEGHLLTEAPPGGGKTHLARTLVCSLATRFSRVQAT